MKRPYRQGEIAMLAQIFGEAIDYGRVRLARGAGLNPIAAVAFRNRTPAITLGRTIHFRADVWQDDFAAAGIDAQALLAHETTHIWQYQTQLGEIAGPPSVALDSLLRGPNPYAVAHLTAEARFEALGYEQQAEAVLEYAAAILAGHREQAVRYEAILRSAGLAETQDLRVLGNSFPQTSP